MIEQVLIAVETALKTIPKLKYINEDWGQLDFHDQPPVLFPCALLECEQVNYTELSRLAQRASASITVRIADAPPIQQRNARAQTACVQRYTMFALIAEVNKVLHGLSGEGFSGLVRVSQRRRRRDDAIREFTLTYTFSFTDASCIAVTTAKPVPPSVSVGSKKIAVTIG